MIDTPELEPFQPEPDEPGSLELWLLSQLDLAVSAADEIENQELEGLMPYLTLNGEMWALLSTGFRYYIQHRNDEAIKPTRPLTEDELWVLAKLIKTDPVPISLGDEIPLVFEDVIYSLLDRGLIKVERGWIRLNVTT